MFDLDISAAAMDDIFNLQEEEEEEVERESFMPCMPRSRELEVDVLGQPGERSKCFGCNYMGQENYTSVGQGDLTKLRNMIRRSYGRCDLVTLCKGMERFYENNIRQKYNARLLPGDEPLPEWPAALIMDHYRFHTQDPELQQIVLLAEIQELRGALFNSCLRKSSKTGKVTGDKDQIACYERLCKLQTHIQKQDATKQAFFSGGEMVDPQSMKQGVIAYSTKNLHDYWNAGGR